MPPPVVVLPAGARSVTTKLQGIGIDASGPVKCTWRLGYHMDKNNLGDAVPAISIKDGPVSEVTFYAIGEYNISFTATNGSNRSDTDTAQGQGGDQHASGSWRDRDQHSGPPRREAQHGDPFRLRQRRRPAVSSRDDDVELVPGERSGQGDICDALAGMHPGGASTRGW